LTIQDVRKEQAGATKRLCREFTGEDLMGDSVGAVMRVAAAALFACLPLAAAQAQSYPTRPITIVVPFPPGASTDFTARLLRDPLSEALAQPVTIDNRPGAGGTTGTSAVAYAVPDGHTLLVTVNAPVTMNMYMQKNFPFDPKTAFAPIATMVDVVLALAVHSLLPVKSVAELIEYAKKNPDKKLSYGSAGIGSAHHIAGELLKQKTGIDMLHVPYRGGGPAIQDLVAGHIPISFGTTPAVLPQANAGTIRIIALAEEKRSPDLPDVPTVAETIPGVVTATWVGLFAPAGTPRPIIDRLNKIVVDTLKRPDVIEKLKQQGATAVGGSPEELGKRVHEELTSWGRIIPSIGIKVE
jgi:tripartite-type tricarboxylate transporter receptor subunit TctC